MSIKQDAKKFLDNCRVIARDERVEGIIVALDPINEFRILKVTCKAGDWNENVIDEFSIIDIVDENDDITVLNFKKEVQNIIGRKRYMIETNVYQFLTNDDTFSDEDEGYEEYLDDSKERARREAEEEEEAEH